MSLKKYHILLLKVQRTIQLHKCFSFAELKLSLKNLVIHFLRNKYSDKQDSLWIPE